jgi:hypothetical protein
MNISSTFLSSLLGGFGVALLLHPPKSDDKNVEEMFTKCSTAQSFILTEMTTYRIVTLMSIKFGFFRCSSDFDFRKQPRALEHSAPKKKP